MPLWGAHTQADEEKDRVLSEHVMAQHATAGAARAIRAHAARDPTVSQLLSGLSHGWCSVSVVGPARVSEVTAGVVSETREAGVWLLLRPHTTLLVECSCSSCTPGEHQLRDRLPLRRDEHFKPIPPELLKKYEFIHYYVDI